MVRMGAVLLFIVLGGISALHVYWAFGGFWPGKDQRSLSNAVIGMKGARAMPSLSLTMLVALLLFGAALLPLVKASLLPLILPPTLVQIGLAGLTGVFGLRGLATYTRTWRRIHCVAPFSFLDRYCYGPLCLLVGAGFAILLQC